MQKNLREIVISAMLAALAFVSMLLIRFPMFAPFLSYDPKDVIIIIGGFLFGPLAAIYTIVVVALVEMITISETGFWGLLMNIISSTAFVIPAVLIYRWKRNLAGAVIGLIVGVIAVTGVMLLWNYLIVPLYVPHVVRADVVPMLASVFLPFNLVKSALNAAIVMLLYKPVSVALQQAGLYQPQAAAPRGRINIWVLVISAFVVLTLILIILAERGVF
ncbi:MAG: ECF transporter S component [Defluviitaleaceae bacterium]|nr:ECF transporter S component [Defluviitaleaceae bacterium]